jgi:hypothetical protein
VTKRFAEGQIIGFLREAEAGLPHGSRCDWVRGRSPLVAM